MGRIALGLMMLTASTSASTPIADGRWLIANRMEDVSINGRRDTGPFPSAEPETVCLTPAAAVRGPGLAFSDQNLCEIVSSTVADGEFAFETKCRAPVSNDSIGTKATGHYTADSYSGMSSSVQRRDGMRIEMHSRMEAKRIGSC